MDQEKFKGTGPEFTVPGPELVKKAEKKETGEADIEHARLLAQQSEGLPSAKEETSQEGLTEKEKRQNLENILQGKDIKFEKGGKGLVALINEDLELSPRDANDVVLADREDEDLRKAA